MRVVVVVGGAVCAFECRVEVEVRTLSLEIEVPVHSERIQEVGSRS